MFTWVLAIGLPATALFPMLRRSVGADTAGTVLAIAIAAGLGTALGAALFCAWRFVAPSGWFSVFPVVDAILWAVVGLTAFRTRTLPVAVVGGWTLEARRVAWALACIAGLSLTHFLLRSAVMPHGEWDAWAIWNLKARFMVRGGEYWRELFSTPIVHPGYPLLVPSAVARVWTWIGAESHVAAVVAAALFTYATPAVVVGSLARLKGWTPAIWGGVLVLGIASFTTYGSWQFADLPLAFLILTSVVLIACDQQSSETRRFAVLAGAAVGLAGLAKNEGLPFTIGMAAFYSGSQLLRGGGERVMRVALFLVAALPFWLILLAIHRASPSVGMVAALADASIMERVTDPGRHAVVIDAIGGRAWVWGGIWPVGMLPILAVALWAGGWRIDPRHRAAAGTAAAALVVMALSYYFAYLVTPYDLGWHIATSFDRILIQIWPTLVWLFCLVAAFDDGARAG